MKKVLLALTAITLLVSCSNTVPILSPKEYTIVDTTYVGTNGFNYILYYDIVLLNRYDSMYHIGTIDTDGKLTGYNPRPIKLR